jgi:hypothetical protein
MKFDLINPSDAYHFEADDLETAAVMVCVLGNGKYGAQQLGGDASVPVFLFGGHDEWFVKHFGREFEESADHVMETKRQALADCFASVTLTAGRRSSINDIGGAAHNIAHKLRESLEAA